MKTALNTNNLAALIRIKRGDSTRLETADDIGDISPKTLFRLEHGQVRDMKLSTFLRLCDWLGIQVDVDMVLKRYPPTKP